ncbi:hypothetical protein BT67DRAFT_458609 [Trichocladium antarcticum]|uniref:Uncharacterized protein n=1 Tax=Trichocladium antarcticum TaxID=1450529 RepID=A0AAN6UCP6_9PEZI|nr:hypothetical protein BT67DRAFT_458609 [Trichocladium antarcticum]
MSFRPSALLLHTDFAPVLSTFQLDIHHSPQLYTYYISLTPSHTHISCASLKLPLHTSRCNANFTRHSIHKPLLQPQFHASIKTPQPPAPTSTMSTTPTAVSSSPAAPPYPGQAYIIAAPAASPAAAAATPANDGGDDKSPSPSPPPPTHEDLISGEITSPRAAPHRTGVRPARGCLRPPHWCRQAQGPRVRLAEEARCVVTGEVCVPHERDCRRWRADLRAQYLAELKEHAPDKWKWLVMMGDYKTERRNMRTEAKKQQREKEEELAKKLLESRLEDMEQQRAEHDGDQPRVLTHSASNSSRMRPLSTTRERTTRRTPCILMPAKEGDCDEGDAKEMRNVGIPWLTAG